MYLYYISLAVRHNGGRGAHHFSPAAAPGRALSLSPGFSDIRTHRQTLDHDCRLARFECFCKSNGQQSGTGLGISERMLMIKAIIKSSSVYGCASAKLASSLLSVPGPCFIARRHSSGTSARTRPAKTRCMSLSLAASHACWRGQSARFPGSMCRRQTLSGCYDPPATPPTRGHTLNAACPHTGTSRPPGALLRHPSKSLMVRRPGAALP